MRERFWWRAAAGLGCTTIVLAFGLPAPVASQGGAAVAPQRIVVIGCLKQSGQGRAGSGGELTITDFRGGPAASFRVDASDNRVSWHVGHTVELAGTIAAGGRGGAGMGPRLTVQSVQYLSTACWEPPKGAVK